VNVRCDSLTESGPARRAPGSTTIPITASEPAESETWSRGPHATARRLAARRALAGRHPRRPGRRRRCTPARQGVRRCSPVSGRDRTITTRKLTRLLSRA